MSIECRQQRKNTCSIEAVRNAYELIHGSFTTEMSDYYNNIYPSIIDNHLLWPYKEAIYNGKKVEIFDKVITIYTETKKIKGVKYGDYWTKRGRKNIYKVYPGQYVYVRDEDDEVTRYIPTKIKYRYEISSKQKIKQKYLQATRGMSLQTSLRVFQDLMKIKFGSNYDQMFYRQIPDVFTEDYREELLVDHLNKGGIAIFAISDFVYPTDTRSRDIISKWATSKYHKDAKPPKIGHAIVCVGFEKEKRNPNTFKPGKTDGKYIMHDSRFWGTSCKFFIDSIYAGKPFIESLPKNCAEAAEKNGGTPGIIKYVYLVSKKEIPGYCSMLKI